MGEWYTAKEISSRFTISLRFRGFIAGNGFVGNLMALGKNHHDNDTGDMLPVFCGVPPSGNERIKALYKRLLKSAQTEEYLASTTSNSILQLPKGLLAISTFYSSFKSK